MWALAIYLGTARNRPGQGGTDVYPLSPKAALHTCLEMIPLVYGEIRYSRYTSQPPDSLLSL